jgi:serine/threonine protein kinase
MVKKGENVIQTKELILDRYEVYPGKKGLLGEGSFSTVQKGKDLKTGLEVAIKFYKNLDELRKNPDKYKTVITKFKRQIEVMTELMKPLTELPKDKKISNDLLLRLNPENMFLRLLDFTKDKHGEPGPQADGKMYVITEIADYSLKDYLAARNEQNATLSYDTIRNISKNFIAVVCVMHAKGYAHLDIKPENMMRAGKHWKLIDVDGCTLLNKTISVTDSTISFSPCYCAPEWARFLIEGEETIMISHLLDVWSVAISLCELILLDPVLKPKYGQIFKQCGSHRKAGFLFLEWLADMDKGLELNKSMLTGVKGDEFKEDHKMYVDLVIKLMLSKDVKKRIGLGEALNSKFLINTPCSSEYSQHERNLLHADTEEEKRLIERAKALRRNRQEEEASEKPPILKTVLFKLNADGDIKKSDDWNKRDMWINHNGAMCYFSVKKQKRMVIVPTEQILRSKVKILSKSDGACMDYAFELKTAETEKEDATGLEDEVYESQFYACESPEDLKLWVKHLNDVIDLKYQNLDTKVAVDQGLIEDYREFKIQVRNRREKIEDESSREFRPVFKLDLWKLSQEGDPMEEKAWLKREMWIAKNGSLCYFSKKENRSLQYFKPDDVRVVTMEKVPDNESCKKNTFILQLPPVDGLEYAPAMFASENLDEEKTLLAYIRKFQKVAAEAAAARKH